MTNNRIAMVLLALALVVGGFSLMHPNVAHAGAFNRRVYLIHGWSDQNSVNCNWGPTFGDIRSYFNAQGYTHLTTLGWYEGDYQTNCDSSLLSASSHCTSWYDNVTTDETVNEDIRHLSCLLAWFFWDHGTAPIAAIAHSMGGIILRQALADTPYVGVFPPYLNISDAVTAGTPHQGLNVDAAGAEIALGCPSPCLQVDQMQNDSGLMQDLNCLCYRSGFGRDPQGSGGTDWTTIASDNDEVLANCPYYPPYEETLGSPGGPTAGICGLMPGAKHFVIYQGPSPYYHHGDYLTDESTTANAYERFSDNNGKNWTTASNSFHSIYTMYEAILLSTW